MNIDPIYESQSDELREAYALQEIAVPAAYAKLAGNIISLQDVDWDNPDHPPKTFIDISSGVPVETVKEIKRDY